MSNVTLKAPAGVLAAFGSDGVQYPVVAGNVAVPQSQVGALLSAGFTNPSGAGATGATAATGATGPTGGTGPVGTGVPAGGATGSVLTKTGSADYNTAWVP